MMKIDKNKILSKVGNIAEGTKKLTSDITEKTKDAVTVVKDKVVTKFDEAKNGELIK